MTDDAALRDRRAVVAGAGGVADAVGTALEEAGARVSTADLVGGGAARRAPQDGGAAELLVCVPVWEEPVLALDLSVDRWQREVTGTLTAAFELAQAAAQGMLAAGKGCIVFVVPHAADAAQRAARQGFVGLTKVLGTEWVGRGIRVVAVTAADAASPADVAPVVVFACSDQAAFVTGSSIVVRGRIAAP